MFMIKKEKEGTGIWFFLFEFKIFDINNSKYLG